MSEDRGYFVHLPAGYELSATRYPLLVVLDGADNFQLASTTADLLADAGRMPPMIVVGIPNTNRNRDLIPPTRGDGGSSAPASSANGANRFLQFVSTELLPKLDTDYRTLPYRILVGHSNGGLFALHALVTAPGTFNGFILASPALGAQDKPLVGSVNAFLDQHRDLAASVYLASANESDLLSGTLELSAGLQAQLARDPHWSFAFQRYREETHGTVTLPGIYDGLKFIFNGWSIPDAFVLYEQGGQAAIEKHYRDLSARFNMPVAVPAGMLLSPAFTLYRQKRTDEAERVILHTLELYPDFTSALLTAGRLYFDKGDKAKARDYLTKALLLSPMSRATGVDYAALELDPNKIVPAVELPASELQKNVGAYGVSGKALEITRRDAKLFVVMNDQQVALTALSPTRFYFNNDDDVITFHRDDRGRVTGLKLEYRGVELKRMQQAMR
ncbi:MAG: alpha/beta hydrolase-fold protein [Pseudomonadota bacterium]